MPDPKQPTDGGDPRKTDAAVLTPSPGDAATLRETTAREGTGIGATPRNSSAFKGALGSGGIEVPFATSIKAQNLLDDKLILSAPRADSNGLKVPVLGGIHLLAKLGQGGMGAVYFGLHPRLHQEVAVKVLPFHLAEQEPGLVQRFIREAQIAAKVRSPHLVGVIDVNEENGLFYLVMEFVSGKSAGDYLRDVTLSGATGLPEKTALAICIGATEGLAAAHTHGVIHRDIKPDNIMIPRTFISSSPSSAAAAAALSPSAKTMRPGEVSYDFDKAKLADLGLARNETGDQSMTAVNVCMGTPGYMSPEQANDAKHASKPADVFSLGATLYALLAGDSPFKGSSLMQTLNLTVNEPHAPIIHVRADVTNRTAQLLDRCLAKKPEDRFPDAHALLYALRQCYENVDDALRTFVYHAPPHVSESAFAGAGAANATSQFSAPQSPFVDPAQAISTLAPPAKAKWFPAVAGILITLLLAGAVGGYFFWQKMEQDKKAAQLAHDREASERLAHESQKETAHLDEMRQAAYNEETRLIDGWLETQRIAEVRKRDGLRAAFSTALRVASDHKKNHEWDKAIATLEDVLANSPTIAQSSRSTAIELLRELKEERARVQDSFTNAFKLAAEAKREQNLDKTIAILEEAFRALGPLPHTSRTMAEILLETSKRERQRAQETFAAAYKSALDLKREQNPEKLIATLGDALKALGTQPHPDRLAAENLLKEALEDRERLQRNEAMSLQALPAALNAALEYKRVRNWDGVILALEEPLKAIGTQPHPNRSTVEALLTEAKEQKEHLRTFRAELEKGAELVRAQNYDAAKMVFENARKTAQDPAEIVLANDGLKRVTDGAKRVRFTQARLFEAQGRMLRPDMKNAKNPDWNKAAEAFKSAAALYQEIDEKDDLARVDVYEADCLRKDNNKTGDWAQAAGLYGNAALLYAGLGDKKSQADAVTKHASCLDPVLNSAGDVRIAANFYGRAAMLDGEVGNKRGMADNLSRQGTCMAKEKNAVATAERAADVFRRAALIYEELGDKKAQGLCIYNQAACVIRERKQNMTPEARLLFQRASRISKEAGDEATAKLADELLK